MSCHLLLEERVPNSYDAEASGNNLLFRLLGVDRVVLVPGGTDLVAEMDAMADAVRSDGRTPYIVPGGGSNALGALGYVACAGELLAQTFDAGLPVDHVVCSSGSGGTHAGLVAGLYGNQSGIPVTGISVRAARDPQEAKIRALAEATGRLAGANTALPANAVEVVDSYVGDGYSLPTDEMTAAIQLFARLEGILLDPVYTGKNAAGLIGLVGDGRFEAGQNVMLIHTGGAPAIYAYPAAVLAERDG